MVESKSQLSTIHVDNSVDNPENPAKRPGGLRTSSICIKNGQIYN